VNVREHYVRGKIRESIDCLLAIADGKDSHTFVSKRQVNNFLNGSRIVGK